MSEALITRRGGASGGFVRTGTLEPRWGMMGTEYRPLGQLHAYTYPSTLKDGFYVCVCAWESGLDVGILATAVTFAVVGGKNVARFRDQNWYERDQFYSVSTGTMHSYSVGGYIYEDYIQIGNDGMSYTSLGTYGAAYPIQCDIIKIG